MTVTVTGSYYTGHKGTVVDVDCDIVTVQLECGDVIEFTRDDLSGLKVERDVQRLRIYGS